MSAQTPVPAAQWSRKNPFPAPILVNRKLSSPDSHKDTRHYEISLAGSGLTYEVGDALGIFPSNWPELVDEIVHALHCTGDELVPAPDGAFKALRDALLTDYAIKEPSKEFLHALAQKVDYPGSLLRELLHPDRKDDLVAYLHGLEVIDFLLDHPSVRFTPEEFVKTLRKLTPRLYSIASSIHAHPEQAHLTVATVRYLCHGRNRKGVASTDLAERMPIGGTMPIFLHSNKGFRLPEDKETPIIMIGPGTGIAPFRAFLQERKFFGGHGKNWLFFGDQHAKDDFLYREELEQFQAEGVLSRLDLAFSRDQPEKIYVQNRMLENAAEFWKWLEEGAHLFVCGDASRMAKNVDFTLHQIIETQGGKTQEQAAEYVESLKKAKRYKRDVY